MCDRYEHDGGHETTIAASPNQFLDALLVAVTNARVYDRGHPRLAGAVAELHGVLERLLDDTSYGVIDLGVADGYAFVNREPVLGAGLSAQRVIEVISQLDAGGLRFKQPLSLMDLTKVSRLMGRPGPDIETWKDANACLEQDDVTQIEFLPEYGGAQEGGNGYRGGLNPNQFVLDLDEELGLVKDTVLPYRTYQEVVDGLQEFSIHVMSGHVPGLTSVQGGVEQILKSLAMDPKALLGISRYEKYDAFTFGHSIRVCSLALNFARALTDNEQVLQHIGEAALLHDVGKVRVPFHILHAPGRLTQKEFQEMKRHTEYGGEILMGMDNVDRSTVQATVCHHEPALRGDGTPMPQSIVTRIVKLCDVYEALTAVRPYKDAMSPVRAYRIMMSMKGAFDPQLLRRFMEVNGVYPIGTRVLLNTGDIGSVHTQTQSMMEPVVEIEKGFCRSTGQRVDLSESTGRNPIRIERILVKTDEIGERAYRVD